MAKETKANGFEKEQRIQVVCDLLTRPGIPKRRQYILQYVAKKTDWDLKTRQIDEYISEATKLLKSIPIDKEMELIKLYHGYDFLEKKNLENEDYKEVRAIWESKGKLFGLNEAEKHDVNVKADFDITKIYKSENQ